MTTLNPKYEQNRYKSAFKFVLFLVCLFLADLIVFAQTTESPLPKPTAPVNDYANVIDEATENRINRRLKILQSQQGIESAVVTVKTTNGQPIFDYTLAVARGWGIGSDDSKRPGLILLVAIDDRKYFTQVSRHLEGDLPDSIIWKIQIENLVPPFKKGLYSQSISDTIDAYIARLEESRGFTLADKTSPTPARKKNSEDDIGISGTTVCCVIIIIIIVFILLIIVSNRNSRGRGNRNSSGWGGGGFGGVIPIPIPINTGGWSGGSSGESSSGSDWGGFSGGGDFGGGGAGGEW